MADKQVTKTGSLQSEMTIALHTNYAIGLWLGRKREKPEGDAPAKHGIIGMPQFFARATQINQDSLSNNPWADEAMYRLEEKLKSASETMSGLISKLDEDMSALPQGVTLTEVSSAEPLDIHVYTRTPLGYRCVFLLVGFDQFAKKVLQASHYGLITRKDRDSYLSEGGRLLRQIYGTVLSYRRVDATRLDAAENNAVWQKACQDAGEPDRAVLLGEKRSAFSPPVNEASVNLLRMRYQAV
ncbi:TIGR03761 family integrating conjugative element protein [Pantoea sp. ICBG 828]|uniref:PFL_4669 family integrating conjugative element protein n=1 Tax=unclassified Pantoea TaxID=2630326 RepID=UPI000CE3DABD|nr:MULTISPECIES: TIGR03761 family integrating conjugative element protein [unclassified Pantoea]NIG34240.1 TIGR03761 family integrating conjugative element protein [Pantoea sp. Ap-959]PPC68166.1 TIGR03761 family integrating conjugative element protein [Pantoea sp. ICBG 828]